MPPTIAEWVALVAALAPIVVVVVWALAHGWVPLGDSAQLMVRSRDVLTHNHPFLGAWSSSSQDAGQDLNNLGPLYVDLIAPFTRIHPAGGTAVGVGLVNAGCVAGVWAVARRVFGPTGAVGAMLATLALEASMGSQALLELRQQLALVLPFWCLLWLAVALWDGRAWAIPPAVLLASLVAQTHFTYLYQTVIVLLAVGISSIPGKWRQRQDPSLALMVGWGAMVAVVCWIQPLWDQAFGLGNLGHVLGAGGGGGGGSKGAASAHPGLGGGAELLSRTTLRPPFTLPGSMGHALGDTPVTGTVHGTSGSWTPVVLWAALVLVVYLLARDRGRRSVAALAGVALASLLGGLVAASVIPPGAFTVVPPQNYYWMWPVGLMLTVAVAAGVGAALSTRWPDGKVLIRVGGLVAVVGLSVATLRPASSLGYVDREANHEQVTAKKLTDQFSGALERTDLRGPVVIDFSRDQDFTTHRYSFLAQLQQNGIDFTFDPRTADLRRFGDDRCERGSARHRLYVESGPSVHLPQPGEVVMASAKDSQGHPVALLLVKEKRPTLDERAALADQCIR